MLCWFAENPDRYWWVVCCAIAGALFLMLRPLLRTDWRDTKRTDWNWGLVILAVLLIGRWPTWFVTRQLNPDENQFIAGALTLRHDPVFWRSVDGMSSGPLNYLALLPVGWLHGVDDYFSARITALLLLAASLILTHQACALLTGVATARIAGFATLCLESLTTQSDFLSYSSELVSICLLGMAAYLMTRRSTTGAAGPGNFAGGLALGAIPLAKLQAVPQAAVLSVGWLICEIWHWRAGGQKDGGKVLALIAGMSAPLIICVIYLTAFGLWTDMGVSYLFNNASYVGAIHLSLWEILQLTWRSAFYEDAMLVCWLAGSGLWLLLTLPLLWPSRPSHWLPTAGAAIFCALTLVCIATPRRPFLHYWQLLPVPWMLLCATGISAACRRLENWPRTLRYGLLLSVLLISVGGLLYARAGVDHPYVGRLVTYQAHPTSRVARELQRFTRPGEALGVWGWMTNLYVEAGLRQATREAYSQMQILGGPYYDYYRRRYLSDLERSLPPIFIDAIGPVDFGFSASHLHHDKIFPELAAYVRTHYTPVADLDGVLIFARNDRLLSTRP
ncbi:MAG: hypothetical protein PHE83_03105 [Opitutaceae bacterium]|nr:hypothetical protein [Opitutaceae bacterium]